LLVQVRPLTLIRTGRNDAVPQTLAEDMAVDWLKAPNAQQHQRRARSIIRITPWRISGRAIGAAVRDRNKCMPVQRDLSNL
jgi:hypothetical protein